MTDEKPRVRFRDYHCKGCGRLLHRSNLDAVALAIPKDLKETHPLLYAALHSVAVDCRCPRCGRNDIATPEFGTNGNGAAMVDEAVASMKIYGKVAKEKEE